MIDKKEKGGKVANEQIGFLSQRCSSHSSRTLISRCSAPARWWSRRLRQPRLRRGVGKLLLICRNVWKPLLPSVPVMPQSSSLGDFADTDPAALHCFVVVLRLVGHVGRPGAEEHRSITSPPRRWRDTSKTRKKLKGFRQNLQSLDWGEKRKRRGFWKMLVKTDVVII